MSNDLNEADVETRYILPLLTARELLAIPLEDIRSKKSLTPRDVGKGSKRKRGYIPDFCVYKLALPVLVIEAKSPTVDIATAYEEAQLYAHSINSGFPPDINPCSRILACNGLDVWVGPWDADPLHKSKAIDLAAGTKALEDLESYIGNEQLSENSTNYNRLLRSSEFKRPFNQGAGPNQINSKISPNTFAADLTPILRRYFSSRDQSIDSRIYEYAYISSDEVTGYDRILGAYLKDRIAKARGQTPIKTTRKKAEALTAAISRFQNSRSISGDVQLITGGVGSGKSLFARRYKEYLQPLDMKAVNHWVFLDFNTAPPDLTKWEEWVYDSFVLSLREEGSIIDVSDAETQERIFAPALHDRQAFYERMEKAQQGRGGLERARDLEQWRQDSRNLTHSLARYIQGDCGENLIVVFDNVDRRESSAQLQAFETALWFMDQTRALILLQMRDATFEAFKDEPPLDTYRTGQIFHISPPRFIDVVKRRLELSLEDLADEAPETVSFKTSKGIGINYPKSRTGEYLRGVYSELFQGVRNSSRILEALAGRNVRRALDMFLALITSGHIPEETIASVAQGHGFSLPEYRVLRALMRQDYRFFNDGSGFVANIFFASSRWQRPNVLLTPEVLFYLISQRRVRGDNGQMGFVAAPRLILEMESLGFVASDVISAMQHLLRKELIEADSSVTDELRQGDCFKATASGWAHMRLLSSRIEYICSVLPTTPIDDDSLRARIFDAMQVENRFGTLSFARQIELVGSFLSYLRHQDEKQRAFPGYANQRPFGSTYIIEKVEDALKHARRDASGRNAQPDLLDT